MATRVICRECTSEVLPDDVNVGEGIAYCRGCGHLSRLSDMLEAVDDPDLDLDRPPPGCRVLHNGMTTVVQASARSGCAAGGTLFAALFWNGIVSVFVLVALGGTVQHIFGTMPSWFPAPNFSGGSGGGLPLGMLIFLWIFLLPFIAIGLMLIGTFLTTCLGRVEARLDDRRCTLFTGFAFVGWRRSFDLAAVESVSIGQTTWKENDQSKPVIVIDAGRRYRVGSVLPEVRRRWMAGVLRRLLVVR